jgi:hypothetical protein
MRFMLRKTFLKLQNRSEDSPPPLGFFNVVEVVGTVWPFSFALMSVGYIVSDDYCFVTILQHYILQEQ